MRASAAPTRGEEFLAHMNTTRLAPDHDDPITMPKLAGDRLEAMFLRIATVPRLPSRLAVCMHEAGHAIVRLDSDPDAYIDWISVGGRTDDELGRVEVSARWQPHYMTPTDSPAAAEALRALAWQDIIFYLAGPIAELRWRRYSRAAMWLGAREMADRCMSAVSPSLESDFGRVRHRLTSAIRGEPHADFIAAWLEAEEQVSRLWKQINWLGRELNECGRIEGDELEEMWARMRSWSTNGSPIGS
jgi:hypothetical protein